MHHAEHGIIMHLVDVFFYYQMVGLTSALFHAWMKREKNGNFMPNRIIDQFVIFTVIDVLIFRN